MTSQHYKAHECRHQQVAASSTHMQAVPEVYEWLCRDLGPAALLQVCTAASELHSKGAGGNRVSRRP